MSAPPKILVVDDTPQNIKLLKDLLEVKGYAVATAVNGEEALTRLAVENPDLVLLDVMMPGLSGYDVCRKIREDPQTALLPVVLCTSLDPQQERIKGIEAGADDFLSKPVNQPELFARVKSLLRVKTLQDRVSRQADELRAWNAKLEERVREQVSQLERFSRLKRFVSPKIGDLILAGEVDDPLKTHRREITVVFTDLRGFTAFTDGAEPEEVMGVLRDYHATLGRVVMAHDGTIEHFAGDGVMILFNDPVPVPRPRARGGPHGARLARGRGEARRGLEKTRPRAGFRRRRRERLRDDGRDRLRRPARLRRDRAGVQPLRPTLLGGEGRPDPRFAARVREDRGNGRHGAGRGARAERLSPLGAGVQCAGFE